MARERTEVKVTTLKKVILLGDSGVGKTELLKSLMNKRFSSRYTPSIGADFITKDYENSKLQVWDLSGSESYEYILKSICRDADVFIICCDLSNRTSFDNLQSHIDNLRGEYADVPIIIAGTKVELEENLRQVSNQGLQQFAEELGCDWVTTSAKIGFNVQELFKIIADKPKAVQEDDVLFDHIGDEFTVGLRTLRHNICRLTNEDFKTALFHLCDKLESNHEQNWLNKNNNKVLQATQTMLTNLQDHKEKYQQIFENYETDCKQTKNLGSTLLKAIGVVIITGIFAAVGVTVGAVLGAGVGILAGAWSGPGAAASGVLGLFTGSVTGWALGVAAAAAVTGIAFGAVGVVLGHHGLFKLNDVEKAVEQVIESGNEASY